MLFSVCLALTLIVKFDCICHAVQAQNNHPIDPYCLIYCFSLVWILADTPIEEFTPTPAFPALQYLESVDEGGVAWKAGLRTGDFLIEVRVQLGFLELSFLERQMLRGGSVASFTAC